MRRFSSYRRGKIFYCQFYNPTTRKYLSGRSAGETNKNAAMLVVHAWFEEGIPDPQTGRRSVVENKNVDIALEAIRNTNLTLYHGRALPCPHAGTRLRGVSKAIEGAFGGVILQEAIIVFFHNRRYSRSRQRLRALMNRTLGWFWIPGAKGSNETGPAKPLLSRKEICSTF